MFNMLTACDTAQVKLVFRLLLNMLQHVLGNSLLCGDVFLLTTCLARKLTRDCYPRHAAACLGGARVPTALQAVRILNICKTFYEIQVPLNFLFKFTGINLVLVNIKVYMNQISCGREMFLKTFR